MNGELIIAVYVTTFITAMLAEELPFCIFPSPGDTKAPIMSFSEKLLLVESKVLEKASKKDYCSIQVKVPP